MARFDAIVRSWLSCADTATISQEKRLMLIVKNIPSPLNDGSSTYAKVINMWRSAMTGLECLLKAWHLYPDLIVLSTETKKGEFADALIPPEAVLTVGLRHNDAREGEEEGGFKWSLALSHLLYHGDPVNVEVKGTNTRVTVRQLHLAILDVLLWYWKVPRSDTLHAAALFEMLWKTIANADRGGCPDRTPPTSLWFWLEAASEAAAELLTSKGEALEVCKMLVDFGRRRGRNFLNTGNKPQYEDDPAFFGLFNPHTIAALSAKPDDESAVQYYHSIAATLGLSSEDLVIAYNLHLPNGDWVVLATALPHVQRSKKRQEDGTEKKRSLHMRWVLSPKYVDVHTKQGQEVKTRLDYSAEKVTPEAIQDLIAWRDHLETLGESIDIWTYNEDRREQSPSFRAWYWHASWFAEIGRASGFDEEFLLTWYAPPAIEPSCHMY